MLSLKNQAIQTALQGDWTSAIALNEQILEEEPNDIDTLNRLGFALLSLGNNKDAKTVYERVLSLDMKNPVAIRNLKRLGDGKTKRVIVLNNLFIEEPGKTKVIDLLNIADKKVVSCLRSGEMLALRIKRNRLFAIDTENQYIGMLPDDISQRLTKFMDAGNQYEAYVRTVDHSKVSIFIRETIRSKKFKNQPSFLSSGEKSKLTIESTSTGKNSKNAYKDIEEDESL